MEALLIQSENACQVPWTYIGFGGGRWWPFIAMGADGLTDPRPLGLSALGKGDGKFDPWMWNDE